MKHEAPSSFAPDLRSPSLAGLTYALRNLDAVAPSLSWDYQNCSNCAMGLAAQMWGHKRAWFDPDELAAMLKIDDGDSKRIFAGLAPHAAVTPSVVADELDKLALVD